MKKTLSISAMVAALVLLAAGPVQAASTGLQSTEPGNESSVAEADLDRLYDLAEVQSDSEIDQLLDSGQPIQALYDVDANEYVAAYAEEPTFSTLAITARGPGCAVGDACARSTGSIFYGYYGTGSATINIQDINRVGAGTHNTTWWTSARDGINVNRNVTVNLTRATFIQRITRA